MRVTGIISEFNPFHRGHTVAIEAARAHTGSQGAVVCVMSGNCVQRGELAIFHKMARAKAALLCGADLVVELSVPYVLSSAEHFARGGVATLAALGSSDTHLAFGCEDLDPAGLTAAARALDEADTQEKIRAGMARGLSYGRASQAALDASCTEKGSALLKKPNNLLAIQYIRAIHKLAVPITPLPLLRRGVEHDALNPAGDYASASCLRELIHSGEAARAWDYMPAAAAAILGRELEEGRGPASLRQLEAVALSLLRQDIAAPAGGYLDDSEGLSRRIINMAAKAGSLEELLALVKTKRYHLSRVRRLIFNICLRISPQDRPETPPYIKILAANKSGRELIRRMKEKEIPTPIISRPAQSKKLDEAAIRMFAIESRVTDFLSLCFASPEARRGGSEWRKMPYLARD